MTSFTNQLATYAKYHRDPRNILTHLFGVPIIVFAVIVLLSRPVLFSINLIDVTPAVIAYIAAMAFYLRLDLKFGLLMSVLIGAGVYAGTFVAALSFTTWLVAGIALFVGGWIIQFVGHHYEGKKPAFVDDLVGLLIGPLFVTAEVLFALGLCSSLKAEIESQAGVIKRATKANAQA